MFYQRKKSNNSCGYLLFALSVIAAFFLGRKSEQYGYTILTRGCWGSNDDDLEADDEWSEESDTSKQ